VIVLNFGGGTNSTALLVQAVNRGIRPDVIVFADTGSEMPHTYQHVEAVSSWLTSHGMRPIDVVRWIRQDGTFTPLHENCIDRAELPSKAYGFSGCTTKWKQQPVDKWLKEHPAIKAEHDAGRAVDRWIGYDADEPQRARRMSEKNPEPHLWRWLAPLIDWNMGRDECIAIIASAGLAQPGKSSCFMCPSMRRGEIERMAARYPDKMAVALAIEEKALQASSKREEATSVRGLGRSFAWRDVARQLPMIPSAVVDVSCGCYDGDE